MSLITLTFGESGYRGTEAPKYSPKVKMDPSVENKVKIRKVCSFYNMDTPYFVGEVVSGVIINGMIAKVNGKQAKIIEVDSRTKGIGKKGMVIGLTVQGISDDELDKDEELTFIPTKAEKIEEKAKKKGKLIIC